MLGSLKKRASARLALGVDIGQHAIKTILLETHPEGAAVLHAARIPTPPGAVQGGKVLQRREVAACLRQLIRQAGYPVHTASLAIPTEQVLVRWIDLPRMDSASLHAATRFEARKYIPYPIDKAEVVIVPMEQADNGEEGRMRALLSAAPKEVVGSRAETLEMAGLEVATAEIEPIALLRAIHSQSGQNGALWRGQPLACVHLGEESSGMFVVRDTSLRFVHAISWGSSRLTQALAGALGGTTEEIEAIKESESASLDEAGIFSYVDAAGKRRQTDVLVAELDRLRREIQRLLNYYRSLFPERSYEGILNRIVLCGGTANLNGFDRYFGNALQIEVRARNPFQSLASRLSPESFQTIKGQNGSFVVAIGLALGELQAVERSAAGGDQSSREFVWRRKVA